jgi:hypothetical protein
MASKEILFVGNAQARAHFRMLTYLFYFVYYFYFCFWPLSLLISFSRYRLWQLSICRRAPKPSSHTVSKTYSFVSISFRYLFTRLYKKKTPTLCCI